jgi:hypothetical protein
LFRKPTERSFSRFLNIGFVCRCSTQRHGETREDAQEARARFGWTPTNPRIQPPEAVRILNGQRSFSDAAHALNGSATHSSGLIVPLRHGSRLVPHQNGIELIQLFSAACEACDARRHTNEWSWCNDWRRGGHSAAAARSSRLASRELENPYYSRQFGSHLENLGSYGNSPRRQEEEE